MNNLYHKDPYTRSCDTRVKAAFVEDSQNCIQVEDTIFHPHGGGQKGDKGILTVGGRVFHVTNTVKDPMSEVGNGLLIVQEAVDEGLANQPVQCELDWGFRYRQMRLHAAVHLHHCMMERVIGHALPHPKTSDIQDGFAFNRYDSKEVTSELVEKASTEFREFVKAGSQVKTYPDPDKPGFRWWECAGFRIPCGGTHLRDIREIGDVEIAYSTKKGMPTVTITLDDNGEDIVGLA